jgi:hypothetical protein
MELTFSAYTTAPLTHTFQKKYDAKLKVIKITRYYNSRVVVGNSNSTVKFDTQNPSKLVYFSKTEILPIQPLFKITQTNPAPTRNKLDRDSQNVRLPEIEQTRHQRRFLTEVK